MLVAIEMKYFRHGEHTWPKMMYTFNGNDIQSSAGQRQASQFIQARTNSVDSCLSTPAYAISHVRPLRKAA